MRPDVRSTRADTADCTGGSPQLHFSNPITLESARKAISLAPAPIHGGEIVGYGDDPSSVVIDPTALAPKTRYRDPRRTGVGRRLQPAPAEPDFGAVLQPAISWSTSGRLQVHIFPVGRDVALDVQATNLPQARFNASLRVLQPSDLVYRDPNDIAGDPTGLLGAPGRWPTVAVHAPYQSNRNATPFVTPGLAARGLDSVAHGVDSETNPSSAGANAALARSTFGGVVQRTNIGLFAQAFPHRAIVARWGRSLRRCSGRRRARRTLRSAHRRKGPAGTGAVRFRDDFDPTGVLTLDGVGFAPCAATSTSATQAPDLLVVAACCRRLVLRADRSVRRRLRRWSKRGLVGRRPRTARDDRIGPRALRSGRDRVLYRDRVFRGKRRPRPRASEFVRRQHRQRRVGPFALCGS